MIEKKIRIRTLRHDETGLLMALSDDLPGLVVHAHSDVELEHKIPVVVRSLLEADGFNVIELTFGRDTETDIEDFGPPAFIANASLTGSREPSRILASN